VLLLSPKSSSSPWSDSGDQSLRVLFIPSRPGYTGLTGALDRSDWCEPLVGFASGELLDSCVFGSRCCWSILGLFGVVFLGFPSVEVVF
jgi:hypothetical protein